MGQGRHTLRSVSDPVYPRVSLAVFAKFSALLCLTQNIARLSRDRIGAEEFEAHVEDVCGQKREEKAQTV